MSRVRSGRNDKSSGSEIFFSLAFVACAVAAGFLVMHKDELLNGNIDEVVAGYVEQAKPAE